MNNLWDNENYINRIDIDKDIVEKNASEYDIYVNNLNFSYTRSDYTKKQVLFNASLEIKQGSRCLLIGPNGASKSTILRIIAGRHLISAEDSHVYCLGKQSFYQTEGISGISFIGDSWTKTVPFAGRGIPYQADIFVKDFNKSLQEQFPERKKKLYEVLEIDEYWRMNEVSDGQRRRVQIMLGLLRPFKILLCDEITVDLDVLARRRFLDFLREESIENNSTIIYATHIFDGLGSSRWATDIIFIDQTILNVVKYDEAIEIVKKHTKVSNESALYTLICNFLLSRFEKREKKRKLIKNDDKNIENTNKHIKIDTINQKSHPFADRYDNGFGSGRMNAYLR